MSEPAGLAALLRAGARNPGAFLRLVRHLPLMARLYWRLFWDSRTVWKARLLLLATFAYVVSPVDLVPELFLGPIGTIDDVAVFIFGCQTFLRMAPPALVEEHLATIQGRPGDGP